jgi:hypothetical protein
MLEKLEINKKIKERKDRKKLEGSRDKARQTYFCIGVSNFWRKKPIHKTLMELRNKHKLKWLRISMSYHRFSNLREIFQGDLTTKLTEDVASKDFMDEECNCHKSTKVGGLCIFGEKCRRKMLVYKCTCKDCGIFYIGQTQNGLKARITGHVSETTKTVKEGESRDTCTFAKHFAKHFEGKATAKEVKEKLKIEVLWQGNPISCMKTFRKLGCKLCMMERVALLKAMEEDPNNTINTRDEIFGACKHKTKFHQYTEKQFFKPKTSTDEARKAENSPLESYAITLDRPVCICKFF